MPHPHAEHNLRIATGELVVDYSPWRHGGWYTNARYPSGAVGCVARRNDGKWQIACDGRANVPTFATRGEAARAEALLLAVRGAVSDEPMPAPDDALRANARQVLDDIEAMSTGTDGAGEFGPFTGDQADDYMVKIEWPNLSISAKALRAALGE